jgi:hypothetical protein
MLTTKFFLQFVWTGEDPHRDAKKLHSQAALPLADPLPEQQSQLL